MGLSNVIPLGLVLLFLAAWAPASAGTVITMAMSGDGVAGPETLRMLIGGRHVRTEFAGGATVYDATTGILRIDDHAGRSYMEMTPDSMAALQGQAASGPDMQAMLREQLAGLPDDQRRQIEAMLARQQPTMPATPKRITYRKTGPAAKVGNWTCDRYERLADGVKTAELCLAPLGTLQIPAADFELLQAMSRRMARQAAHGPGSAGAMAELDFDALTKAAGQASFPVKTVEFQHSRASVTSTVTSVERRDLPASLFAVPAGYAKESLPGVTR
jgi:Domain of unknown function (DUF4412)